MFGNIHIINPESFLKELEDLHCGRRYIAQIDSKNFELQQSNTKPLAGFEFPEGFPDCCEGHKQLYKIGLERLVKFPDCCEEHKKLKDTAWFKKENYNYFPDKFVTTIIYTWHCISKCINNKDWYKEITDYIEYTKKSYGQFPDGFGSPLGIELYLYNLEKNIENEKEMRQEKKSKLIEFIKDYSEKIGNIEPIDINLLISKYKEWLKIFPFEISFFSHLKPAFEKTMPILKGEGTTNLYSGLTGFHLKTKDELIKTLSDLTLKILTEINTASLYQQGFLTQPKQVQLEIILANRKLELDELTKSKADKKEKYIKLLKKWLTGEKKFLKEINPLITEVSEKKSFIDDIIDGMKQLQKDDSNVFCISNVRDNGPNKEAAFRYWFVDFFSARYQNDIITAEE